MGCATLERGETEMCWGRQETETCDERAEQLENRRIVMAD